MTQITSFMIASTLPQLLVLHAPSEFSKILVSVLIKVWCFEAQPFKGDLTSWRMLGLRIALNLTWNFY